MTTSQTHTSLTIVRRIKAAPEDVFRAFVEPAKIRRWWGPDGGPVLLAEVDPRPGGRFHVRFRTEDGGEHGSTGTFAEYDPPRRLVMDWAWESEPDAVSRVEVVLRAVEEGTELTFTHARLPDEASRRSHESGWNGALDKLETMFGETGS